MGRVRHGLFDGGGHAFGGAEVRFDGDGARSVGVRAARRRSPWRGLARRPVMATRTPSAARARAMARPRPPVEAATRAVLPLIPRSISSSPPWSGGGRIAGPGAAAASARCVRSPVRRTSGNGRGRCPDAGVGNQSALAQAFLADRQRDLRLLLEVDQRQVGQQGIAGGLVAVRLPGPHAGDERLRVGESGHRPRGAGHELVQQPLAAEAAEDRDVEGCGEVPDRHGRGRGLGLDRGDEAAGLHHGNERLGADVDAAGQRVVLQHHVGAGGLVDGVQVRDDHTGVGGVGLDHDGRQPVPGGGLDGDGFPRRPCR